MTIKSGVLTPRPYARLLTMLSEQLIKNNTIALTELAKNSYDADANWVRIRIGNMKNYGKEGLSDKEKPFVEIEDDGDGMSFDTIKDSWMNPASPNKYIKRMRNELTKKGRIIQGEKGIGRYAVFQIGKNVGIITRERVGKENGGNEIVLLTDISGFSNEFISDTNLSSEEEPLYFDQIISKYNIRDTPVYIKPSPIIIEGKKETKKDHGTIIRITELNYQITRTNAKKVREVLSRLQSPFRKTKDFDVSIVYEGDEISAFEDFKLEEVLSDAMLEMKGSVKEDGICEYTLNGQKGVLNLVEHLKQEWFPPNREYFIDDEHNRMRKPVCGHFQFRFYVYDLDKIDDKELNRYIKDHRTYIYRDDIRIYPYGDKDHDWIKLDTYRGVYKAGYYLSNDQLIGYVSISSAGNPELRDKTNREGLLEQGTAYEDLRILILSVLNFLNTEFQKTKLKTGIKPKHYKARKNKLYLQSEKVEKRIDNLNKHLEKNKDLEGKKIINKLTEDYYKERNIFKKQIDIVEDLAGVGIAVDATSHDVMVMMNRACETTKEISKIVHSNAPDMEKLKDKTDALEGQIMHINGLLVGIQPLFRSSRRKRKELRISDIVKTVVHYYDTPLKKNNIKVDVSEIGAPLIVTSSEGVLLQLFINLIDNSVYWLKVSQPEEPKIEVLIDGDKGYVIFADNGLGVRKEDIDYIFEPFFSTKGLQGRGLGLYIARQLTDKYEYDLYYIEKKSERILSGANFRIDFIEQED